MFGELLSFWRPLTSQNLKCISLNKEPYLARTSSVDLSANELH